jgi:hypothetical protein
MSALPSIATAKAGRASWRRHLRPVAADPTVATRRHIGVTFLCGSGVRNQAAAHVLSLRCRKSRSVEALRLSANSSEPALSAMSVVKISREQRKMLSGRLPIGAGPEHPQS